MFHANLEYHKDYLYVQVKGNVSNDDIRLLKLRIYHAMQEYGIYHIVIDLKEAFNVDPNIFYEFVHKYELGRSQSLEVIEF